MRNTHVFRLRALRAARLLAAFRHGAGLVLRPVNALRLLGLAVIVFWKLWDPMGLDPPVTGQALVLESRLASLWYPRCLGLACNGGGLGRDQVLVVLFDDTFHQRIGHRLPSFADYAAVVDALRAAGARAIGLDIFLGKTAPQDSLAPLLAAVGRARQASMPVVVAQKTHPDDAAITCADGTRLPGGPQDPDLACAATSLGQVGWQLDLPVYYPLFVGQSAATAQPSLAWATYLQLSGRTGAGAAPRGRELADDMFLLWGRAAPDGTPSCAAPAVTPASPASGPRCTYIPHLSAVNFLPGAQGAGTQAAALAKNRTVFISLGFRDIEDYVDPPNGDRLPGVFMHATALDNLLTLGGDRYYVYRNPEYSGIETSSFLGLAAYIAAWMMDAAFERLRGHPAPSEHAAGSLPAFLHRLAPGIVAVVFFLFKCGVIFILAWLLGLAPFNAGATITLCVLVEEITSLMSRFKEGKHGHAVHQE